jgi:hypothetical protein
MIGPVSWFAAARQFVSFTRVAHQFNPLLLSAENREELFGLADRHAVV